MLTIIIIGEVNIRIGAKTGSKILSNIIKYVAIIGMQGIHSMAPNINVVINISTNECFVDKNYCISSTSELKL